MNCHSVRSKLQEGLLLLHHINTCDQLTDILIIAFTRIKHSSIMDKLAVITTFNLRRDSWVGREGQLLELGQLDVFFSTCINSAMYSVYFT